MVKKTVKKAAPKTKATPQVTYGRAHTSLDDFKTAALLVSLGLNLAVFIGWLALKVTWIYDEQVARFLFG